MLAMLYNCIKKKLPANLAHPYVSQLVVYIYCMHGYWYHFIMNDCVVYLLTVFWSCCMPFSIVSENKRGIVCAFVYSSTELFKYRIVCDLQCSVGKIFFF